MRRVFFLICVALIIVEIFLRLFSHYGWEVRSGYSMPVIQQIYGQTRAAEYADVLEAQQAPFESLPFIGHREASRYTRFITVTEDGVRCNQDGVETCPFRGGDGAVWVFGGSTTFGYGVKNSETIPAYIEKNLRNYSVFNLGVGHFYSTPERILFQQLLTFTPPPEIVVFIDGLNDFYHLDVPDTAPSEEFRQRWLDMSVGDRLISLGRRVIRESRVAVLIYRFFNAKTPRINQNSSAPDDSMINAAADRMIQNFRMRAAIAEIYGTRIIQVIQPIPGKGLGHKFSKVPPHLINLGAHQNSTLGYSVMAKWMRQLQPMKDVYDLSDLSICAPMYIDSVHYSREFNELIARTIVEKIKYEKGGPQAECE